jgi:hypothetical protein
MKDGDFPLQQNCVPEGIMASRQGLRGRSQPYDEPAAVVQREEQTTHLVLSLSTACLATGPALEKDGEMAKSPDIWALKWKDDLYTVYIMAI